MPEGVDLKNDHGEKEDVAEEYPDVAEFLESKLKEIIDSNKVINVEGEKINKVKLDKQLKEQIKSLGYLQQFSFY